METVTYLLVLLGDGQFHYFTFSRETGALTYIEKVFIGAQPTALLKIDREGATNIFIGSERPIMMYSSNNKLVFSDLLSNVVVDLCLLNSEKYKNCFVISDEKALSISTIESAPRLHVRSITTGEAVKKIAYQKETNTIGILCERPEGTSKSSISKSATLLTRAGPDIAANIRNTNGSDDGMVHSFVLLNADTFEPLHTYEFPYNEHVVSITSAKLGSDPKTYYIVGTAIIRNREFRVSSGRITFFEANLGNPHFLVRVFEKHTRGCPFSVNVLRSNLIVALNSSVRVFKWIMPDRADLKLECSYFNNLSASQVKVEGDLVVVDDVLRSFGILSYNPVENTLEERARDYRGMCMTALEFIDADTIIGSDIGYNIIVGKLTKPPHFDSYEFLEKGLYHIGEAISTFQRGVFRASSLNRSISIGQPVIYGTTDGTIGMVAQIPHETYRLLAAVESVVIKKLPNYARIPYTSYRRFETEGAVDVAFGFIDGDMVEFTLKLSREDQLELFSSLQIPDYLSMNAEQTVDEVMEKVNDLARIH
ncbi:unnamed protein product [Auanema sp. JU1783]|nr:unnamed protein product [Auanema sp. JU1783]